MTDLTHLNALHLRLSHERARPMTALRKVWIAQIEKEIAHERAFLGLTDDAPTSMSDDDLLAALTA